MNSYTKFTVCLFGLRELEEGGRLWTIRNGLIENGISVLFCQSDVPGFISKYRNLYKTWKSIANEIDAIYVIFMGFYFMPLAWYLSRRKNIPVVLDALISQYDTEVNDRKRISRYNPRSWFLWVVDFISYFIADAVVVDTKAHGDFFRKKFFVAKNKIIVVSVGSRSDIFKPLFNSKKVSDKFVVEFHGSFIPLQGVEYIISAAKILQEKDKNIHFILIGKGQTYDRIFKMSNKFQLTNITFFNRMPLKEISEIVNNAHVCLGIFGTSEKALRVIPHKVYDCLSSGKAVITERSPAVIELLHDRKDILMVEPGNSEDLAKKILELKNNPELRLYLENNAYKISSELFSPKRMVKGLVEWFIGRQILN